MIKTIFMFLVFSSAIYSQNIELENKFVEGLIYSQEGTFLILNEGYLKVSSSDPYEEYYREIYNDSTIVNPNTELKSTFDFNIIPFLNPFAGSKKHLFENQYDLGVFINFEGYNNTYLKPAALAIIDSIMTNQDN